MEVQARRGGIRAEDAAPPASVAAVKLFACFSRFEFALKEAGYIFPGRGARAQPDWRRFAKLPAVSEIFEGLRLDDPVLPLVQEPPREQIVSDGALDWRDAAPIEDGPALIDAIKRVRNNLFHGGKSGADPRDDVLCAAATVALCALLDADDTVRWAFLGKY